MPCAEGPTCVRKRPSRSSSTPDSAGAAAAAGGRGGRGVRGGSRGVAAEGRRCTRPAASGGGS